MRTLIILILLHQAAWSFGQVWNQEIKKAATDLANQLSSKKIKLTGVADFTYNGQENTHIGFYLANKLSGQMTAAGVAIKDREAVRSALAKSPDRNSGSGVPIDKESVKDVSVVVDGQATKKAKEEALIDIGAKTFDILNKPSNPLKGIDAIVFGNIVTIGDNLELTLTITKISKRKEQIGFAEVSFPQTPDLADLIGGSGASGAAIVPPPTALNNANPNSTATTIASEVTPFKNQNFTFEMVGCSQTGRSVECKLSILSSEQNADLWVYFEGTRFFDASSGAEFQLAEVKLADVSSTPRWRVGKTLIADSPIDAVFHFKEVNRQISSISMLQIQCAGFDAKLNNIPVR